MTERRDDNQAPDQTASAEYDPHVADDLAAGQGTAASGAPAEDVAQLATIRDPIDQGSAVLAADDVEHTSGGSNHVRMYEGYLEAGDPGGSEESRDVESVDLLLEDELRVGETENPHEAAEEGLTWVPPVDPPVVAGEDGQIEVAAGFGTTAADEPFDADHHRSFELAGDERTERVREALGSHAQTVGLADRLQVDTEGSVVVVSGTVEDLDDEDAVLEVISEVEGVTDVVNRIRVTAAE